MNPGACNRLLPAPLAGSWFRAVPPTRVSGVLSTSHGCVAPTRFDAGGGRIELLYFSDDPVVALVEHGSVAGALTGGFARRPRRSPMIASVDIRLSAVADLTSVDQQKRLMTNAQELTGDWAGHSLRALHSPVPEPRNCPAPTQELGLALHADPRIEGFVTVSARMPTHRNLIVFPGKLRATSSISFRHPETDDILTIP